MRPRRYSSEGIVLARKSYSEADRILVLFSKNYGKLHLIAKGVRKPKSKKRGSLEVFSHIKFSAGRGKDLDLVEEVETIDYFPKVRDDLRRVAVAYFLVETVGRLTREEEKDVEVFNLLIRALKNLRKGKSLKKLREDFTYDILVLLGFWPKDKIIEKHDRVLEEVVERKMFSIRVGKRIQN